MPCHYAFFCHSTSGGECKLDFGGPQGNSAQKRFRVQLAMNNPTKAMLIAVAFAVAACHSTAALDIAAQDTRSVLMTGQHHRHTRVRGKLGSANDLRTDASKSMTNRFGRRAHTGSAISSRKCGSSRISKGDATVRQGSPRSAIRRSSIGPRCPAASFK